MKTIIMPCSCGMKNCSTVLEIEEDTETKGNFKLTIKDDKHEYSSWISIDRHDLFDTIKRLQVKNHEHI